MDDIISKLLSKLKAKINPTSEVIKSWSKGFFLMCFFNQDLNSTKKFANLFDFLKSETAIEIPFNID